MNGSYYKGSLAFGNAPASSYALPPRGPLPSEIYARYVDVAGEYQAKIYWWEAMSELLEQGYDTLSSNEKKEVDEYRAQQRAAATRQAEEREARNKAERNGLEAKRLADEAYEANLAAYKERQEKKSFFRKALNAVTCSGERCPVRKRGGGTRKASKASKGRKARHSRRINRRD